MPVPVAARSKAWFCGRSHAMMVGSNPAGSWKFVSCECCVFSDSGLCVGLATRPERNPTEGFVSECDSETSTMRRSLSP